MLTQRRRQPRVLFVGEAVTLAHVGRPLALIDKVAKDVNVVFAADPRYRSLYSGYAGHQEKIWSIPSADFLKALATGRPVYDTDTLRRYVNDDLRLIAKTNPDIIVGDFRLSLGVSARLAKVPYVSLTNAHWSPQVTRRFPVPDISFTRALGRTLAGPLFHLAWPMAQRIHAKPLNQVAKEHGLGQPYKSLTEVYTVADHTAFADVPQLFPQTMLPAGHSFLGPLLWEPEVPEPAWWADPPADRPIIYVTLGTSGAAELLNPLLAALAELPVTVIAATAGRVEATEVPANVFVAKHLPGSKAARRADLVICNGGSGTVYQAVAGSARTIGICSNMDQLLTMSIVERAGLGKRFYAHGLRLNRLIRMVKQQLAVAANDNGARIFANHSAKTDIRANFLQIVRQLSDSQNGVVTTPAAEPASETKSWRSAEVAPTG